MLHWLFLHINFKTLILTWQGLIWSFLHNWCNSSTINILKWGTMWPNLGQDWDSRMYHLWARKPNSCEGAIRWPLPAKIGLRSIWKSINKEKFNYYDNYVEGPPKLRNQEIRQKLIYKSELRCQPHISQKLQQLEIFIDWM